VSAPSTAPSFLQGDSKCRLGKLDRKEVAGNDGYTTIADAREEGIAYGVGRLRGEQGLYAFAMASSAAWRLAGTGQEGGPRCAA